MSLINAWLWLMAWVLTTALWARICSQRIKFGNKGTLRSSGLGLAVQVLGLSGSTVLALIQWNSDVAGWLDGFRIVFALFHILYSLLWHLMLSFGSRPQEEYDLNSKLDHYFA